MAPPKNSTQVNIYVAALLLLSLHLFDILQDEGLLKSTIKRKTDFCSTESFPPKIPLPALFAILNDWMSVCGCSFATNICISPRHGPRRSVVLKKKEHICPFPKRKERVTQDLIRKKQVYLIMLRLQVILQLLVNVRCSSVHISAATYYYEFEQGQFKFSFLLE